MKEMFIHPSAIISDAATLGNNVSIGPFCIVGPEVVLEDNVELKSHVVISGRTRVGEGTVVYSFAVLGNPPQHLKYKNEPSELIIGKNNVIREYVTMHPGTEAGGMVTQIGNNCYFMIGVHIAHDCKIGNNTLFANYVSLAGHVEVGDHVIIGGLSGVLQFVRIGSYSIVGGLSGVDKDVLPYSLVNAKRANLEGLNLIGMKRRGIDSNMSLEASKAVQEIFTKNNDLFLKRLEDAKKKYKNNSIVMQIVEFIEKDISRPLCGPEKSNN